MKPLVIYHDDCADGFGAAFAAWLELGDDAEYVPCQYATDPKALVDLVTLPDRTVYILDFSFKREDTDWLFANAKRVVWLDHHKTAFEMWCPEERTRFWSLGRDDIILDNNKSGAMLAWEYFHPHTEVPMLIQHIDDYDRWVFALEGTKAFNKALWSRPWSFVDWKERFLPELGFCNYEAYYSEGAAILRVHDQNVQSVVKGSARKCAIEMPRGVKLEQKWPWLNGLAANCPPHLTSDVGHELAVQPGTFGLCWTLDQEGLIAKCSLRSNGDYDVSTIAKAFGGGGHKNAAGFEVPMATLIGWMI